MVRGDVSTRSEANGAPAQPFVYVQSWSLEPGEHELRVAVRDTSTGELGAARVPVEVLETTSGWRSSDLMLLTDAGAGAPEHVARGRVVEGEAVTVYVEVANAVAPVTSGRIIDAEAVDSPPALLLARPLRQDSSGVHRGGMSFRGLPAGVYSLEISVTDERADRRKDFIRPLEVVDQPGATRLSPGEDIPLPMDLDLGSEETLSILLERLNRVAGLYMDQALSFAADEHIEEIRYFDRRRPPRRKRDYQFEYVYGLIDDEAASRFEGVPPGRYTDYRRPKGEDGGERVTDEVLENLLLPMLISKSYFFPLIFREILWPMHDFEIVGEETVLERPAIEVSIIPKPPIRAHMNGWFGTAWFDRETLQPLQFEVFDEENFKVYSAYESSLRGEGPEDDFTFTKVTAQFGAEKNGMRFPSEIVIDRSRFRVKGRPDDRRVSDRLEFRVTQRYSNYQFFNVRTEDEVRALVFGRAIRD
jgi:hypothetical protein